MSSRFCKKARFSSQIGHIFYNKTKKRRVSPPFQLVVFKDFIKRQIRTGYRSLDFPYISTLSSEKYLVISISSSIVALPFATTTERYLQLKISNSSFEITPAYGS